MNPIRTSLKESAISKLAIIAGSACLGIAVNVFIKPNSLALGGFSGVGLLLDYTFHIPLGIFIFSANIPLIIISWKIWDRRFMLDSAFGVITGSLFIEIFSRFENICLIVDEPLLPAIYGGLLSGLGTGLVLRGGGTMGGNDILARIAEKFKGISVGTFYLVSDSLIIGATAVVNGPVAALYSLIVVFIYSIVVNKIVDGLDYGKHVFIISSKSDAIGDFIINELGHAFTYLNGAGGYSRREFRIIMCVVNRWELFTLKKAVHHIDDKAFLIADDAHEVYGEGFRFIE